MSMRNLSARFVHRVLAPGAGVDCSLRIARCRRHLRVPGEHAAGVVCGLEHAGDDRGFEVLHHLRALGLCGSGFLPWRWPTVNWRRQVR